MNYPVFYKADVRVLEFPGSMQAPPRYFAEFLISVDRPRVERVLAKRDYQDYEAVYAASFIASEEASKIVSAHARTTPHDVQLSAQPSRVHVDRKLLEKIPVIASNDGVEIRILSENPQSA